MERRQRIDGETLMKQASLAMLRDELGVQEESAAAIMQDIHALRQQWKIEPAGSEDIEMDSVACSTPADSIGYDSSSDSDGGTIARLIVKLGARPPERVVARRVPLVSTEYLGMVPSSDSEPGEPDTQRDTSDRGSPPHMPDNDSNMLLADSDTDSVDSDIPLAELLMDSGSDYPDSDAPLASAGLLEGMRHMGIASAALRSAFYRSKCAFSFIHYSRGTCHSRDLGLLAMPMPDFLDASDDTFWFCRARHSRLTKDAVSTMSDSKQALLWNRMLRVQAETMHLLGSSADNANDTDSDSILPLYGESDDEGEMSDSLMREIDDEQKETAVRTAKMASAEARRVEMVRDVIHEMVEQYAMAWHERVQPKLEASAFYLWGRYIGRRDTLKQRLSDLSNRRLLRTQQSVLDSGVSTRQQAKALCSGLRTTIEDIAQISWLLNLLSGPRPLRPPRASPPARALPTETTSVDEAAIGHSAPSEEQPGEGEVEAGDAVDAEDSSANDGDDNDSMADFIDDDDEPDYREKEPAKLVVPVEIEPTDRLPKPHMPRRGRYHYRKGPRRSANRFGRQSRYKRSAEVIDHGPDFKQTLDEDLAEIDSSEAEADGGSVEAVKLARVLATHSASEVYDAAVFYTREMSVSSTAMFNPELESKSSPRQLPRVELDYALWLRSEFQRWIIALLPTVRARYPSAELRDKAHERLNALLPDDADIPTASLDDRRKIGRYLARVSRSVVRCPVLDPYACQLDADDSPLDATELLVPTASKPGVLMMLRDDFVADKAAFTMFYRWCC
ncbi:hypothetical protein H4R23_001240, partial [Coemansia sp. Cherry 401B]